MLRYTFDYLTQPQYAICSGTYNYTSPRASHKLIERGARADTTVLRALYNHDSIADSTVSVARLSRSVLQLMDVKRVRFSAVLSRTWIEWWNELWYQSTQLSRKHTTYS